jgi:tripartite-type tricarboxylate transporter receptor subunit TctC
MRLAGLVASLALSGAAFAQAASAPFPSKPITLIVFIAAGGTTDITARMVARNMEKTLGQPIIVENRPGANGTIATHYVRTAAPDGYTVLIAGLAMNSTFVKNNPVNLETDLQPVSNLVNGGFFVFVPASLPVNSMQELIAYSKANPGKVNLGYTSALTLLASEGLKLKTGMNFTAIPYKGAGPMIPAVLSGEVTFTVESLPTFAPHLQAGKVKALMATSARRSAVLPNVPSAAEVGIKDYEAGFNLGLWVPLKTPREAVQKLSAAAAAAMKAPDVVEQMGKMGAEPVGSTPEELVRTHVTLQKGLDDAAKASNFQPQ